MDRKEFEQKFLLPVADKPQLVGLLRFHLDNLWAACDGLRAASGHVVAVDFEPTPAPLQYPKVLYHDHQAPIEVQNSMEESTALGQGFRTELHAPSSLTKAVEHLATEPE